MLWGYSEFIEHWNENKEPERNQPESSEHALFK
jgi:hypothetical protein